MPIVDHVSDCKQHMSPLGELILQRSNRLSIVITEGAEAQVLEKSTGGGLGNIL